MAHFARNLFFALAAGAAGGAAASLLQRDGGKTHPLAKGAVLAGLRAYQGLKSAAGELTETMSDIVAEAASEIGAEVEQVETASAPQRGNGAGEQVVSFEARPAAERERQAHG